MERWVAGFRKPVDDGPAGILEPEQLGDLIKRLAGCIITRAAKELVFERFFNQHQLRVTTRDHEAQKRIPRPLLLSEHGIDMPFDMVDEIEEHTSELQSRGQ